MNLADAIRQAAQRATEEQVQEVVPAPVVPNFVAPHETTAQTPAPIIEEEDNDTDFVFEAVAAESSEAPQAPHAAAKAGNAVRIELFLSPEQMSTMLRSIISSQHTMMTLREAASYLRINAPTLEEMAQKGEVPAIHIDGRWRFSRNVVDEWLTAKSFQQERQSDVA